MSTQLLKKLSTRLLLPGLIILIIAAATLPVMAKESGQTVPTAGPSRTPTLQASPSATATNQPGTQSPTQTNLPPGQFTATNTPAAGYTPGAFTATPNATYPVAPTLPGINPTVPQNTNAVPTSSIEQTASVSATPLAPAAATQAATTQSASTQVSTPTPTPAADFDPISGTLGALIILAAIIIFVVLLLGRRKTAK